jgi:hypothetical protein
MILNEKVAFHQQVGIERIIQLVQRDGHIAVTLTTFLLIAADQ